ncbi:MAG: hypothetical protein ACKOVH_06305 [Actinomycetota bacterium]
MSLRDARSTRSARRARRARRIGGAALVGILTLVGLVGLGSGVASPPPAGAHGNAATMGLEVVPGPEPRSARVRVLLEYANDGHLATGAVVTASAIGPGGATLAPTPVPDDADGRYATVLALPAAGAWTVIVTAAGPDASARADVTVLDAGAATTTPGTRPSAPSAPPPGPRSATSPATADDGNGWVLAAGAVVVGAGVVVGVVAASRRRRKPRG